MLISLDLPSFLKALNGSRTGLMDKQREEPALHLFQREMKTKIIHIICTPSTEKHKYNTNRFAQCVAEVFGVKGHRATTLTSMSLRCV